MDARCNEEFPAIKKGRNFGIFAVHGESLDVHEICPRGDFPTWQSFVERLPQNLCCHVFAHFKYTAESDGVERSKFVNILWAPAGARGKDKMTITFFAEKTLMALGALGACRLEAGSLADLEEAVVREKILRHVTVK